MASGRPLQRPAHRLHQQDGPHRRGLRRLRAVDARPARRASRPDPSADRKRGTLLRDRRSRRHEGDHVRERARDGDVRRGDSGEPRRRRPRRPPRAHRSRRRVRRRAHRGVPRRRGLRDAGDDPQRAPQGDAGRRDHPGARRLGVQEQGRPVSARRDRRLPPEPARRPARPRARSEVRGGAESARPTTTRRSPPSPSRS